MYTSFNMYRSLNTNFNICIQVSNLHYVYIKKKKIYANISEPLSVEERENVSREGGEKELHQI